MADDGTSFEIDVDVQAEGLTPAAAALAELADRLTAAGQASTQAAEAVAVGQKAYDQTEAAADRAAKSLERISIAADAQRGKLQAALDAGDMSGADRAMAKLEALTERQAEARAKAEEARDAMEQEAQSLDLLKSAAAEAIANEEQLSQAHEQAASAAEDEEEASEGAGEAMRGGAVNSRALASALGFLGGPLGSAGQKGAQLFGAFQRLGSQLGELGPYVGAAVAIAAIATAAIAATVAITGYAIGLADTARTQGLLSAGIARSVQGGQQLQAAIGDISKKVPLSNDELMSMASNLANTGLRGKQLTDALDKAATKAATLKFGPDFAKEMLSLDNQSATLHKNIAGLFGGLNIEGLLGGLSKIVAMFDSTSATGKAIKVVFESLFQPVVDGITSLEPKVVSFFIQFEIWVLKALIAIKPFGSKIAAVGEVVGTGAAIIVAALAAVVAIILVGSAAAFALVAGLVYLSQKSIEVGQAVGTYLRGAFQSVVSTIQGVYDYLSGLSLTELAAALIQGLADGITGAGGAVLSSITGVVSGAVDGAKKLLGIASPSKVFAEIGMHTAAGMAGGIDAGAGDVQGAIGGMIGSPDAAASPAPSSSSSSSGGGLNFAGAQFTFNGVEGAEDAESRFFGLLTRLLEGDTAQLGAMTPDPAGGT